MRSEFTVALNYTRATRSLFRKLKNDKCTALVVGSDDVASSYCIGVLDGTPGWQKGRKSGGSCSRQVLSWRAPISSISKPAVTRLKMKSPGVNPGDQVIRDRRSRDIAKDEVR